MRTTLKRGIGRAAAVDGNGNGRAVLPPSVLEPMRRYRQPPPPKRSVRRLVALAVGWTAVAIVVVAAGLAGGLYLYGHQTLNDLAARSKPVVQSTGDLHTVPPPSQPAIALIAGYDRRMGADATSFAGSRSDTIMLVRADPQNDTLSMLSFPRDLVVPIYCTPDAVYTHSRINSAWSLCPNGPRGTLDTVEKLTGLQINYLITVDFHGFKLLVNKLHGVYMNVDHRYYNPPHDGYATINLHPGYQKLDGGQALSFVRFRHTDSDLYRLARQQLFLDALKGRLANSLSLFEIPKIIGALKGNIEIARGGGGAPDLQEIQSYAGLAYRLPAGHLFRNHIDLSQLQPYGPAGAELTAPQSAIDAAVSAFEHPDVSLPNRANDAALGRKPKKPAHHKKLQPSQISTLVLNGTHIAGLATNTTYLLAKHGYDTKELPPTIPANAPSQGYSITRVYYDPVQPDAEQAAKELDPLFGSHTKIAALSPAIASYAAQASNPLTVVVLGSSFDGKLTLPRPPAPAPAHQPAAVTKDPGATLGALQAVRSQTPFPIMAPQEIATGSRLSSLEGVRVYKPAPHQHALVMTFVTAAGNIYWQIEESTWKDAPALAHPTDKVHIGGRVYDLYTVGGHIQMIVLRRGDMRYWVVNTLLNELSNETMIAIAKSLQPLGK